MDSFKLSVVATAMLLATAVFSTEATTKEEKGAGRRHEIEEVKVYAQKLDIPLPEIKLLHVYNPITNKWYYSEELAAKKNRG